VSPEDDAEVRRVFYQNLGTRPREIQGYIIRRALPGITGRRRAIRRFSNLFVQTEFVPDVGALLATRTQAIQ